MSGFGRANSRVGPHSHRPANSHTPSSASSGRQQPQSSSGTFGRTSSSGRIQVAGVADVLPFSVVQEPIGRGGVHSGRDKADSVHHDGLTMDSANNGVIPLAPAPEDGGSESGEIESDEGDPGFFISKRPQTRPRETVRPAQGSALPDPRGKIREEHSAATKRPVSADTSKEPRISATSFKRLAAVSLSYESKDKSIYSASSSSSDDEDSRSDSGREVESNRGENERKTLDRTQVKSSSSSAYTSNVSNHGKVRVNSPRHSSASTITRSASMENRRSTSSSTIPKAKAKFYSFGSSVSRDRTERESDSIGRHRESRTHPVLTKRASQGSVESQRSEDNSRKRGRNG